MEPLPGRPTRTGADRRREPGAQVTLPRPRLFQSFFAGGFECSTFRLASGQRLDLVASTRHDAFALEDYKRLMAHGLRVAREGVRWHLVERVPGEYDFSTLRPIVRAAGLTGTQVVWDLCHFGWPDHLDIFKPQFLTAFAAYAAALAEWLANETSEPGLYVPINEISFFSWAAGEEGSIFPFVTRRGFELKRQLVRAAIGAMDAIWAVQPEARFVHVDPVIHVLPHPRHPEDRDAAEAYRQSQFQAWDMLAGRVCPDLGGAEKYLDITGVNFYPHNEWFYDLKGVRRVRKFTPISRRHPLYRPFSEILAEVYERYRRPLWIGETGAENRARANWLHYMCEESAAVLRSGLPLHGICLYPILNHPGWVDDRHCHNGLWDYAGDDGHREIYTPLATEVRRWQRVFQSNSALAQTADPTDGFRRGEEDAFTSPGVSLG